jgi:cytochrome P450
MARTEHSTCPVRNLERDYNPFVDPQLNDPFPVWALARSESPVFHSDVLDAWVVSRYRDIVEVLRNPGVFGSVAARKMFARGCPEADRILAELPPLEETNPLASEPPIHTKLRRYLQPAFMPQRVASWESNLRGIAHSIIDTFESRGHGDFYADYAYRYPLVVVCRLIGLPAEYQDQVKEWASMRVDLRNADLDPEEQVVAARAQIDYYEFTLDLVSQRRTNPGDDLLSWIIQDSDSSHDPLTDAQLASQATSLLTAGHETTSYWLTITMRRLLRNRELWAAMAADAATRNAVLEEALRLDGPVQSIWRKTKTKVELGGVTIPAGARVSVVLASGNLDAEKFEASEEFRLDRANATHHVTFGRGIHTCVGAGIARLEGRVSLEVLAMRLPKLRLASDGGGMTFKSSATQRIPKQLFVEWM